MKKCEICNADLNDNEFYICDKCNKKHALKPELIEDIIKRVLKKSKPKE